MKLLRTIRLDPSDTFIFERAAEPGELGGDRHLHVRWRRPAALEGKTRAAFRAGFLGVASFGWSTLVQIVEASDDDRLAAIDALANGSSRFSARPALRNVAAAEEEFEFAASLCNHPLDTLIAMHRSADGGEIRETFRTLRPKDGPNRCGRLRSLTSRARKNRRRPSISRLWQKSLIARVDRCDIALGVPCGTWVSRAAATNASIAPSS